MFSLKHRVLQFILVCAISVCPIARAQTFYVTPPYAVRQGSQWLGNFQEYEKAIAAGEEDIKNWWLADCSLTRQEEFTGFEFDGVAHGYVTIVWYTVSGPGTAGNPNCVSYIGWQRRFDIQANARSYSVGENLGQQSCDMNNYCGNPINVAIGNKYEVQADIGDSNLNFSRYYNSRTEARTDIVGLHWTHTYSRRVSHVGRGSSASAVLVYRPDGGLSTFTAGALGWTNDAAAGDQLNELKAADGTTTGWRFISKNSREVEQYDASGRLLSIWILGRPSSSVSIFYSSNVPSDLGYAQIAFVEDVNGRRLRFEYNESGWLTRLVAPDAKYFDYQYDVLGRLISVIYPDGYGKQYSYAEEDHSPWGIPSDLTGIFDELSVRYATFNYDGYPTSTEHAGGVEKFSVQYDSGNSVLITGPLGASQNRTFAELGGVKKATSLIEQCQGCDPRTTTYSYDGSGNLDVVADPTGISTDYDYGSRGLVVQTIKSANRPATKRIIQTDWDPDFALPSERRTYDAVGALVAKESWTYDGRGQVQSVSKTDPQSGSARTTLKTYCEQPDIDAGTCPLLGLTTSLDGPRTDVADTTSYAYYPSDDATCATAPTTCPHRKGDLWKVTDALGHVTETLRYDGAGRPLSVQDTNGVVTDFAYHPRGWLTARKVRGTDNGSETDDQITQIAYYPTGLVSSVTLPDGSFTSYVYDAAHRLADIVDADGNRLHYTLDNAGNRIKEEVLGEDDSLKRTLSRVYNQLGQLQMQKDAGNHATDFTYDANGNNQTVTDALGRVADNDYDPLNRLVRTLQDVGGIAAETKFAYDALDNLTQVTDPKGLNTTYAYNGLGDLTQLSSPDTGITAYTYDSAGNRASQTDARGVTTTYGYDALNRLTGVAYPGDPALDVGYQYDTAASACQSGETFAVGRLSQVTDGSGSTQYCYDRFGDTVRKVQTTDGHTFTLRYAYTKAGQLSAITYPDGTAVDYVRDGQGRIAEIGVATPGNPRDVLLTGASYHPFGPVAGWAYGNGRTLTRTVDLDYRPQAILDPAAGGLDLGFGYDAVGNLTQVSSGSPPPIDVVYDALGRLTETRDGPTQAVIDAYGYDATGNRTSFTNTGGTQAYAYPMDSHRLSSVNSVVRTYDAMGNTMAIGGTAKEFVYNAANRMSVVKQNGTVAMNYAYNGKGERVRRHVGTTGAYTVYDEAGHWLGDYASNGTPLQQAVWMDDLPVGVLANGQLHYIESDHLGSPRVVVEVARNVPVWTWDMKGEAFGSTAPDQDPDGDSIPFVFDMRFPGQRYDAATGLNYNYFRDYEPGGGRYVQSDPIGLDGGINTYAYTFSNPAMWIDPNGQQVAMPIPVGPGMAGAAGAAGAYNPDATGLNDVGPKISGEDVANAIQWMNMSSVPGLVNQLAKELVKQECENDDDECEKRREREETLCQLLAGPRYPGNPKKAVAICKKAAFERYAKCLRGIPESEWPPLTGVETPI